MKQLVRCLLLPAALLLASPAFAHSTVKNSVPASGSVIPASPAEVVLTFNEASRITSVVLSEPGKDNRKLATLPAGQATTFTITDPMLGIGRNEIKWKALSKDGHPIEGSIILIVKPGAAPSSPPPGASEHHDH